MRFPETTMSTGPRGGPPVPSISMAPRTTIVLKGPAPSPAPRFGAGVSVSRWSGCSASGCAGFWAALFPPGAPATRTAWLIGTVRASATSAEARFMCRLLFLQLSVNHADVLLRLICVRRVALVRLRDGVLRGGRIGALARLHLELDPREEFLVEVRVLVQVRPRHHIAVTGDDAVDALDGAVSLGERVADRHAAAAVVRVEQRRSLAREDVAGVHDPQ